MKKVLNLLSNIFFLIRKKGLPGSFVIVCKKNRNKKRFLLIKSYHSNAITFPSGNLNPFEDFSEAALRELFEETGLKAKKEKLTSVSLTHEFRYKNLPFQIKSQQKVFLLSYTEKIYHPNPQDKDIEWARWYNEDKTLTLLSYPELKTTLKKVIEYLKNNHE